jgi:zinc protease
MTWTADVARRVLPNGLTLLVERRASAPVVAVVTHVKAGYFDEPDEWVGIAHVLEHMYFKGTARRGPGDVARETQLLGGYINAGTIYDKTVYYTVLPSAAGGLERALDIQADALMHAALDTDELGRELEVIVQEARRKLDTPAAVAAEGLYELLFRVHRMRRWRIGTVEGLRRLTADDVRSYHATRYAPGRVVVGIVGDLDPERALDAAADVYGGWSRAAAAVPGSPPEPDGADGAIRVLHGDLERPLVNVGWRTVGTLHPDAAALDLAGVVLGGGRGSRLYRAVRLPGLAASAHASHYTPTEVGVFELSLEGDPERVDAAVSRAGELTAALAEEGPAEPELERARALVATQWARRLEGMDGRASMLCEAEALGDYRLTDELFRRAMEVGADDVRRVAREYLVVEAASAVFYLPRGVTTRHETAWPPAWPARVTSVADSVPPVADSPRGSRGGKVVQVGAVSHRAEAGIDLLVRPGSGTGLVTILLRVPGPPAAETADSAGISWLLARSALRGAGGRSGEELAQMAERLGGGVAPAVGSEVMGWGLTVRADAAEEAARLLRIVALEPGLQEDDVVRERALQASDARRVRDDMFRYPIQRVLHQAFPEDAYGLPALGEPDQLLALAPERVRAWAGALAGRRAVAVAVGDLEREELLDALEPLAHWPAPAAPESGERAVQWRPGRGAEGRDKEQTALAMAFPAAPFGSPDRYPQAVLRALLSGLAGRLFEELRERRSLAYTVAALPWLARRAGAVLTYIATSPEREAEARDTMLAELQRVFLEPPQPDELERARNYAAGTVEVGRQRGSAVAGEVLEAWVHGVLGELEDVPGRLRDVSGEDVVRVAEAAFREELRAEFVVRGASGSSAAAP